MSGPSARLDFTATLPNGSGGVNGTCFNSSGLMVAASAPRIDYDPFLIALTGGLPCRLSEDERTNYLFPSVPSVAGGWGAGWGHSGDTLTTNATTGPDGAPASMLFLRDGTLSETPIDRQLSGLPSQTVGNAWVKGTKGQSVFMFLDNGSRANWIIHTFSSVWERTADVLNVSADAFFYFSTARHTWGGVDTVKAFRQSPSTFALRRAEWGLRHFHDLDRDGPGYQNSR